MDLYHRPANLFVAGFIGSPKMNFIALAPQDGNVRLPDGNVRLPDGTAIRLAGAGAERARTLGVRADQLHPAADPARALIAGEVSVVERLGDADYAWLGAPWGQEIVARFEGGTTPGPGTRLALDLTDRVHFFDEAGLALPGLSVTGHTS
jgi:ABC-type sugar transport system ATPase subunit